MGRRRWQNYQQLLMENVQLKDEDKPMEKKDWESSDKRNFCDESSNTSQQTVDNIVPESEEQSKTKSHSSESSYETEDSEDDLADHGHTLNYRRSPSTTDSIPHSLYFPKTKLNSMSNFETVASTVAAASMAAVAAMNNFPFHKLENFRLPADVVPQWFLPTGLKAESSSIKKDESDVDTVDEQPLDLSAKSCSPVNSPVESPTEASSPLFVASHNFSAGSTTSLSPQSSLKVPIYPSGQIFKAKPRLSPITGRRTYTEDELQAALRDIQSGKLGTRRAAAVYGIPRSTLRNKVYKLAIERERENSSIILPNISLIDERRTAEAEVDPPSDEKEELEDIRENDAEEEDETEKELSANEDEKEPFVKPTFTAEDLYRISKPNPLVESESIKALLLENSKFIAAQQLLKQEKDLTSTTTTNTSASTSTTTPSPLPPPLYSIFAPGAPEIWGNLDPASIAPYLNQLRDNLNISSLLAQHPANAYFGRQPNSNESPTEIPPFAPKFPVPLFPDLMQRIIADATAEEQQRKRELQKNSTAKSTPIESSTFSSPVAEVNHDDSTSTTPNILHRLPFLKPLYVRNGSTESAMLDYNHLDNRTSEDSEKSITSSPPPASNNRSESSSPLPSNHKINVNLREAIAKTIGQKFQQPQELSSPLPHIPVSSGNHEGLARLAFPMTGNSVGGYKTHSMSTDDRKLCNPKVPLTSSGSSSGGGKGTRPKRGKYRNYDRDSLIEAVRAVQRGEMSVHRAGSHFGVPHSTLEYKVKERHLMRPRKREPKNQPDDLKRREDGSILRLSGISEKSSAGVATAQHSPSSGGSQPKLSKSPFTPPSSLPSTPNGLKMPTLFEAGHFAPTPTFPFWPGHLHQLAMDYSRSPAFNAAAAAAANPEHILASHFMQRMQEESAKSTSAALAPSALASSLGKSAREVAESLYDGSGINGSFLDGVIRSSLDNDQSFSESLQKKNLLEQLYRNKYFSPGSSRGDESDEETGKPSINQILAHTLLSSVANASKEKGCGRRRSPEDGDDLDESVKRKKNDESCLPNKNDDICQGNGQNQSLTIESHIVNKEIKREPN